jgi:DNA-dependent RNA polymerase auxiliary subunit epsilon
MYEVNYDCRENYPPFSHSNNSVHVNANSAAEARKIFKSLNSNKINFVRELIPINR